MTKALAINRPQRWDEPFDPNMSEADVDRVLALDVFQNIDAPSFPKNQALRDIIKYDARLQRYQRGDIVVRSGDYGNSVFVIIKGTVSVLLEDLQDSSLGPRVGRDKRSFLGVLGQLWNNARMPEVRDVERGVGEELLEVALVARVAAPDLQETRQPAPTARSPCCPSALP